MTARCPLAERAIAPAPRAGVQLVRKRRVAQRAGGEFGSVLVIEAIVAARPFASTADLLAVKGMGPKLLEKIRTLVRL